MDELIKALRSEAGRSGAEAVLELLKNFNPYSIEEQLEFPLPMAFLDGWQEVLELLLAEARKV